MFGMRCDDCGEVRWSFLGRFEEVDRTCPACGAQMSEERRHPGRSSTRWMKDERREHADVGARAKVS